MKKMIITVLLTASVVGVAGCQKESIKETTAAETTVGITNETPETTQQTAEDIDLQDIYSEVKAAYGEDFLPSMVYDTQAFEDKFGITDDLYVNYIAEGPAITVHVDQFIGVEAEKGKGAEVEALLDQYQKKLLDDTLQYPVNQVKIKTSEVIRHDDYVFFVMLGNPSQESEKQGEEAILESAKEKNRIAVDIINRYFE